MFKLKIHRPYLLLACICFLMVLFCAACPGTDTMFTTIELAISSLAVIITGLGSLIPASDVALVEGVATAVSDGVSVVQAAWDAYEKNPGGAGLLEALQAAVANLQSSIPGILAGFNITNPTLAAWVTTLVGLVGKLAADIAADILPKLAEATTAHQAGNSQPIKDLEAKFKALNAQFIIDHDTKLDASGLPPDVITAVHKHFKH